MTGVYAGLVKTIAPGAGRLSDCAHERGGVTAEIMKLKMIQPEMNRNGNVFFKIFMTLSSCGAAHFKWVAGLIFFRKSIDTMGESVFW